MKFRVNAKLLAGKLSGIVSVIPNKTTLDILTHLHITVAEKQITIRATDLEIDISDTCPAEVFKEGDLCIPGKMFYNIIQAAGDTEIQVELIDARIHITFGKVKYNLFFNDSDQYPELNQVDYSDKIVLKSDTLRTGIDSTIFCCSTDILRAALNGIYFEPTANSLNFVATDGSRLIRLKFKEFKKKDNQEPFIIPAKAASLILSMIEEESDAPITIESNETNFRISYKTIIFSGILYATKYPNYEKVVPVEFKNVAETDKEKFSLALKLAGITAHEITMLTNLDISANGIKIKSDGDNGSNDNELECEFTGEDTEIGFNYRYLQESVQKFDNGTISINFNDPTSAVILKQISENSKID